MAKVALDAALFSFTAGRGRIPFMSLARFRRACIRSLAEMPITSSAFPLSLAPYSTLITGDRNRPNHSVERTAAGLVFYALSS